MKKLKKINIKHTRIEIRSSANKFQFLYYPIPSLSYPQFISSQLFSFCVFTNCYNLNSNLNISIPLYEFFLINKNYSPTQCVIQVGNSSERVNHQFLMNNGQTEYSKQSQFDKTNPLGLIEVVLEVDPKRILFAKTKKSKLNPEMNFSTKSY